MTYRKLSTIKTADEFQEYLDQNNLSIPFDADLLQPSVSPFAQPLNIDGLHVGNRFTALPMEGWDCTTDGRPTEFTIRRWQHFGLSGAKLIWGGEAVAVRPDGRANPNQLILNNSTVDDIARLRQELLNSHEAACGRTDDLVIGLQLTHSGRYARPTDKKKLASQLAYDHPFLNPRAGLSIPSGKVLTDDEIDELIHDYIKAALLAEEAGYDFVDIKHCHGYLGHELLSAVDRLGRYGGSLENRTRFARNIITGIHHVAPDLHIGVRLSLFDFVPFQPGPDGTGQPQAVDQPYRFAFGSDRTGLGIDLTEPIAMIRMLQTLGVNMLCLTAGSPYYNPHIQRPAYYPPSDGYQPPEDPLIGTARQIMAVAQIKAALPEVVMVGSAYSYLQEWMPNVAQAVIRLGMADSVGLGRLLLSYPELPNDLLAGRPIQKKRLCRTFSDCTTAPRMGLVSGCYPLDPHYKGLSEAKLLTESKKNK